MIWRKMWILWIVSFALILSGCGETTYPTISKTKNFVASVNLQAPSISFINDKGKVFTTWKLDEGYTGATLIDHDYILLYGYQLKKATVYNLSTGKQEYTIATGIGITNAIYDKKHQKVYLANGKTNRISAYFSNGKLAKTQKVGNYPMSMIIHDQQLYIVNYKDTTLSILQTNTLKPLKEWTIEKSSNGMQIVKNKELWIGGHGEGIKPNSTADIYDLQTGERISQIKLPLMPVGFAKSQDRVYVISHGDSALSEVDFNGKVIRKMEVGANPFTVTIFKDNIVVAGYDDHHVYFLQNGKIAKTINVGKGPFQLLVRGNEE
ncbi:YncE family protein [Rummeliibacillus sp. POC4]|uniref:YncE family protein n=1 Tax=Rummeliibacillus sp. POC4 TaxID=2305899 RepID=UPI000E65F80A|nr:hypothetical protein [Rummeliibacillus sp. POC4]RIJ67923.1 hypothetical protein D1606_03270 [Rummeliibacillus sp. POC4]